MKKMILAVLIMAASGVTTGFGQNSKTETTQNTAIIMTWCINAETATKKAIGPKAAMVSSLQNCSRQMGPASTPTMQQVIRIPAHISCGKDIGSGSRSGSSSMNCMSVDSTCITRNTKFSLNSTDKYASSHPLFHWGSRARLISFLCRGAISTV